MAGSWEETFDNFMNPQKHIAHSALFVASAVLTLIYAMQSSTNDNTVTLTNFKMLCVEDLYDRTAKIDKAALYTRWKCNSPIDPWGPDGMCRCIQKANCTDSECGGATETACYKTVAPTYANVFAGYDVGYLNVMIAFFLIHIAVLLNMTIETKEMELLAAKSTGQGTPEITPEDNGPANANDGVTPGNGADEPKNDAKNGKDDDADGHHENDENYPGYLGKRPFVDRKYGSKMTAMRHFRPITAANDGHTIPLIGGSQVIHGRTMPTLDRSIIQNEQARLFVLLVLSGVCVVCSIVSVAKKEDARKASGQTCDPFGANTCMAQTLLGFMALFWSLINFILFAVESYRHMFHIDRDPAKTLTSHFLATVLEDVNHTVAFMLLAASFSALSGVHDDTTIVFDILVVTFIGFLQNVQHNIMLAREWVIEYCRTAEANQAVWTDQLGRIFTVERDVVSYFLYTRLFIFVAMIDTAVVFLQRIEPSILTNDTNDTWYYYMRNVALLISVLPSIIADISYEIYHTVRLRTTGEHTPYVGAHFWRRTIFLFYIIIFILLAWKQEALEKK